MPDLHRRSARRNDDLCGEEPRDSSPSRKTGGINGRYPYCSAAMSPSTASVCGTVEIRELHRSPRTDPSPRSSSRQTDDRGRATATVPRQADRSTRHQGHATGKRITVGGDSNMPTNSTLGRGPRGRRELHGRSRGKHRGAPTEDGAADGPPRRVAPRAALPRSKGDARQRHVRARYNNEIR